MPAAKSKQQARNLSQTEWRLQKIRQLESESRLLKDQLSSAALKSAGQLFLITQIYNVASLASRKSEPLNKIKQMIEQATITSLLSSSNAPDQPTLSCSSSIRQHGSPTPTITSPTSLESGPLSGEDQVSGEDDSDGSTSRGVEPRGQTSNPDRNFRVALKDNVKENAYTADLLAFDTDVHKEGTEAKENGNSSIMAETSFLGKEIKPKYIGEHVKSEKKVETRPKVEEHEEKERGDDDDDDDDDETWHEYTLEEELEGIADAPAKDRAAMRIALREKEEARRKVMRQSAAEKRKIAEMEGLQLKQTLLRPDPPDKKGRNTPISMQSKNSNTFSAGIVGSSTAKAASNVPDGTELNKREVSAGDSSEDDTSQSSSIISVDTESPKSTDRFGIVFDPSKLDAAMTARISGAADSKDTRRSILIQNIPLEFSMHKLLAYIRGGTIITARMVPDALHAECRQEAMITLKTAKEAHACRSLTESILAQSELTADVRVSLLPSPTYPSRETVPATDPGAFSLSIVEEPTRCVVVYNFPKHFVDALCAELYLGVRRFPNKMHALEEMWFAGDALHIHFTSVQEAVKAHQIISVFYYCKYKAQVHFAPDPCAAQVHNMADVFAGGAVKVASYGHQGLRSLLETVGLGTYSRNQENLYAQRLKDGSPSKSGGRAGMPDSAMKRGAASLLIDIFDQPEAAAVEGRGRLDTPTKTKLEAPLSIQSIPWTDDLMVGLDKL